MPFKFRFRLIPFIAALVAVLIGVSAGNWQTRRGDQKQAMEDRMTQRANEPALQLGPEPIGLEKIEFAPVRVRGTFVTQWPLFLENRPLNGKAGFYVLMPLKIEGSEQHIMVMRGWAPRDLAERDKLPAFSTPAGTVELDGLVRKDAGHVLELGSAAAPAPGALTQNFDPAAFSAASKISLLPYVLEQRSDTRDGLQRDWPRASLGIDKHRGYAFQWYGLACAALLFFIVTGFRRAKA